MNKRVYIMLAVLLSVSMSAISRNINISDDGDYGNTFQIDCSEAVSETSTTVYLYDDGGQSSNYQANRSYIKEIASTNGGSINMKFTQFNLASGTLITIKDAVSHAILVSNATGTQLNGQTFTSSRGALQIIWTSSSNTGAGFAAKIWCGSMCQAFQTVITPSVSPTVEDGETYYDICNGASLSFSTSLYKI